MPAININGKYRNISWNHLVSYAMLEGISADIFLNRHGKIVEGNQGIPFHLNAVTTQTENTVEIPIFNTATTFAQTQINTNTQEIHTFVDTLTNAEAKVHKAPPNTNSNALLQDIIKYKAMTLRKNESNAFEKTYTLKEKPMEWCTTQGMVGIEIEVENITNSLFPLAYWDVKADGSLRNNGVELVSVPLQIKQVQLALEHVYNILTANNKPDFSNRTSIHIHVNCRDLTQNQIYNFILLYALFEKHFYSLAGNKRLNSIFCVPLFRTNQLNVIDNVVYGLSPNWHKYCGINLLPLYQNNGTQGYGTIEFRHLYGTSNQREILEWINDIMCLRKYACEVSKDDLLKNIKEMNTTSSYISLYSQVFAKGRKVLSNKKDFEECVSNIKRELFGDEYLNTVKRSDQSDYWLTVNNLGIRG